LSFFSKKEEGNPESKPDVCMMHQKPKLVSSSEEYKEEEDSDFSFANNQKFTVIPTVKKLSLVENVRKKIPPSDLEEEERTTYFIAKRKVS
jgi:hypothetical protein